MLAIEYISVAETIEYLDISETSFNAWRKNDILRCSINTTKGTLNVLCKDVENVKEVLDRTENKQLPKGFTRTWA